MNVQKIVKENISQTKKDIAAAFTADTQLIKLVNTLEELRKAELHLVKRLREHYAFSNPEEEHQNKETTDLLQVVLEGKKKSEMGVTFSKELEKQLLSQAKLVQEINKETTNTSTLLEKEAKKTIPHLTTTLGAELASTLLRHAGGLKKLAFHSSSTIQVMGAEKALFRHLEKGTKNPKYGILYNHPLVNHAPYKKRGKAARTLADKTVIAARQDYFAKDTTSTPPTPANPNYLPQKKQ